MSFSPPSDFIDDSSSTPWGKIILGAGGGCLALVLVVGALSTWGTCTATKGCCNRLEEAHRATVQPIQEFLDAVGEGDTHRAYLNLSDQYRDAHSEEELSELIEQSGDLFRGGEAMFVGARAVRRGNGIRLFVSVQVKDPQKRRSKGVATFLMRETGKRSDSGHPLRVIEGIWVGTPPELQEEDAIRAVVQTHLNRLGSGDISGARQLLDPKFAGQMDEEAFATFVDSQGELFAEGGQATIKDLESDGKEAKAIVEIVDLRNLRPRGVVVYQMRRAAMQWRIAEIRTEMPGAD